MKNENEPRARLIIFQILDGKLGCDFRWPSTNLVVFADVTPNFGARLRSILIRISFYSKKTTIGCCLAKRSGKLCSEPLEDRFRGSAVVLIMQCYPSVANKYLVANVW